MEEIKMSTCQFTSNQEAVMGRFSYVRLLCSGSCFMDCVRLSSATELNHTWTKIMLCGLKNMKNTHYSEVTWASRNLFMTFNTSFSKIKHLKIFWNFTPCPPPTIIQSLWTISYIWFACKNFLEWLLEHICAHVDVTMIHTWKSRQ